MVTIKKDIAVSNKKTTAIPQGLAKLFKQTIVIIVLLGIWEVVPRLGLVDRVFFPPFSEVVQAFWRMLISGDLWAHFSASIVRSALGFFIAIIIAVPLGLLLGWYPLAHELFNPVLEIFRNTAALALLPVFILFLGVGEVSKVSIIIFACIWPILLNTINAVKEVDPLFIKSAKSMNLNDFQIFRKVILPASVPTIFTGIRMAGTGAILVLIAAEMIGAKEGLGYLITFTQFNFQIAEMYAGILTISILGVVINQVLLTIEKQFSKWKQPIG